MTLDERQLSLLLCELTGTLTGTYPDEPSLKAAAVSAIAYFFGNLLVEGVPYGEKVERVAKEFNTTPDLVRALFQQPAVELAYRRLAISDATPRLTITLGQHAKA
jgi:hypothetical protein